MRKLTRYWPALILGVYVLVGFGRFIRADYASSDWWPVVATNHLESLSDISRLFVEAQGARDPEYLRVVALNYRPLGTASLALDYRMWGFLEPWGYQLTDLTIHLVVVFLTYLLGRELGLPRWASVLSALVFTSHPAIVSTVPGIARRFDTLSAGFGLASIVLLLRGGPKRLALAAFLFGCSVLSKETSLVMLPLSAGLLLIRRLPFWRIAWLIPPVALAVGLRVLMLGSLAGYGTAQMPRPEMLGSYRDGFVHFLEAFAIPGPQIGTYAELTLRLSVLVVIVIAAAWLCPPAERSIALFGLAWFLLYGEAYAFLRVYNGWYLYQPLIGIGLLVGALAAGGARAWPTRRAVPALVLAGSALVVAVHSSTLVTPYPEWLDVGAQTTAYLAAVDTCTEDGHPPLVPRDKGPYADVVEATGLADYSVRAYLQLRFPNGRPCEKN